MCLIINNPEIQVSDKNIICYKLCYLFIHNEYLSVYRGHHYYLNKIIKSTIGRPRFNNKTKEYIIYSGLHSFKNIEDAIKESKNFNLASILKCIISKGVNYTEGLYISPNGISYESYVSNRLIPITTIK